ncbi:uncharacterized protein LOC125025788 isoform X1 [Penaeus chinensis]|uniref:uncharacterized protein LOC125025788 isoform X1 n=2 Tax=Penaeus chinensis TaxID=139456 RepID=UPI001FB7CE9A|nr:uncharacterized protein LOC125025788 isoform X1 [Penaeus chinensis]XP_047469970.1 uncharacterized protein LOC125025788 isoform X1 [Penaeus chinensis]
MLEVISVATMGDQISCVICKEIYASGEREPVMLPECGHTFCRHCLTSLPEVICPVCKRLHIGKSVEDLPINFAQLGISDYLSNAKEREYLEKCPEHGLPLDLWCTDSEREICTRCYFEETKRSHEQFINIEQKRQKAVSIIEGRSLILSQVYLALKHSLTMERENSCRNIYTKRLNDILKGGRPFLGKLEKLKMLLSPADNEPANYADNREGEGQGKKTTFCVALNTDGRKARLTWEQGSLNLHALSDEDVDAHIMVKMTDILLMIPQEEPTVFLDVANATGNLGRICIKVWSNLRRGQQFLALCQGHLGPTLRGSTFLDAVSESGTICLRGGRYLSEDGPTSRALMDNLEWDGIHQLPGRKGYITGWSFQKEEDETLFGILLNDSFNDFCCPFGEVVEGLSVVEEVANCSAVEEVTIVEVGRVIPEFVTDE